ncbi:MAG: hypothetical protein RMJ98_15500 [Myxococcales bacterium]|nr:hypothetical protein [Polyangiaceae bacterium]MDW8250700.1 hypothetical protein [Myxococcales bacterium]
MGGGAGPYRREIECHRAGLLARAASGVHPGCGAALLRGRCDPLPLSRCIYLLALLPVCLGCKRDPVPANTTAPPVASSPPTAIAAPSLPATPTLAASGSATLWKSGPPGPPPPFKGGITLDPRPVDIGTGSLVELGAVGAVVRRKDDEILLVRLGEKIVPLSDDGKLYARGKTLLIDRGKDTMSYWITGGKLRRRLIDAEGKTAPVETIAEDAEDGTVPHGVRNEGGSAVAQDVVAYVARQRSQDGERHAQVWVEGKGVLPLSSEGSGAASVWVTATAPGRLVIVWNDARAALTPVHAAPLELDGAGEPRVGPETMLWMGSPSASFPSISAVRTEGGLVTLLPLPRNGLDFGLAAIPVVFGARPLEDALWLDYPNGLDPAPVLPARFCDKPLIALVRPTARPPSSPKVVELASIESSGRITVRLEVGRASRIDHLSSWVSPKGDGWVAWVGDGRTWVRHVRCGK